MKKLIGFFLLIILVGCSTPSVSNIQTDDVAKLIAKKDTILIDCRTEEEYASGHIPGATLLPLDELQRNIESFDKNKTYVVICRSGNRSSTFTDSLVSNKFKHVYNVLGGMNAWKGEVVTGIE